MICKINKAGSKEASHQAIHSYVAIASAANIFRHNHSTRMHSIHFFHKEPLYTCSSRCLHPPALSSLILMHATLSSTCLLSPRYSAPTQQLYRSKVFTREKIYFNQVDVDEYDRVEEESRTYIYTMRSMKNNKLAEEKTHDVIASLSNHRDKVDTIMTVSLTIATLHHHVLLCLDHNPPWIWREVIMNRASGPSWWGINRKYYAFVQVLCYSLS